MGTRQRQVKQNQSCDNAAPSTGSSNYLQTRQKSFKKMKYLLIASLAILASTYTSFASGFPTFVNEASTALDPRTPTYVIIFDAGSTGTRINLFTFHTSIRTGQLVLDDETFHQTRPGLSSFANSPAGVRKSLNVLLDIARKEIPPSQWSSTPISLLATAGLRLLPGNLAQNILDECKRVFASSGFKVNEDSVAIMDGADEGIYSWFTANFLLDRFGESANTVATLDLGGGSLQVTFSVSPDAIDPRSPHAKNIHHVSALNRDISVFTESFLGMGLMAARKQILTHDHAKTKGAKEIQLTAECMPATSTGVKWNYAGKDYIIKGKVIDGKAAIGFSKCIDVIKTVVNSAIPHDLPSLREYVIYASSYIFERMTEAGLIDAKTGGIVSVESIYKVASKVCENPKVDEPFMCLDLSYIYVLLHDGFRLDKSSTIFMRRHIGDNQWSWALGAAFNLLQSNAYRFYFST